MRHIPPTIFAVLFAVYVWQNVEPKVGTKAAIVVAGCAAFLAGFTYSSIRQAIIGRRR